MNLDIWLEPDNFDRELYLTWQHNWSEIRRHMPTMYSDILAYQTEKSNEILDYINVNSKSINEVLDARTDLTGKTYSSLSDRLNNRDLYKFSTLEVVL